MLSVGRAGKEQESRPSPKPGAWGMGCPRLVLLQSLVGYGELLPLGSLGVRASAVCHAGQK